MKSNAATMATHIMTAILLISYCSFSDEALLRLV